MHMNFHKSFQWFIHSVFVFFILELLLRLGHTLHPIYSWIPVYNQIFLHDI